MANAPWAFQKQHAVHPCRAVGQVGRTRHITVPSILQGQIPSCAVRSMPRRLGFRPNIRALGCGNGADRPSSWCAHHPCNNTLSAKLVRLIALQWTSHSSQDSHDIYNTWCVVKRMNVVVKVEISNPCARSPSSQIGPFHEWAYAPYARRFGCSACRSSSVPHTKSKARTEP